MTRLVLLECTLKRVCKDKFPKAEIFEYHSNLLRVFKKRLERAGIPRDKFNLHSLRHTFASHFLMKGGSTVALSRVLGHSSIQTTIDIYGHLSTEFQAEHVHRLDSLLENVGLNEKKVVPLQK